MPGPESVQAGPPIVLGGSTSAEPVTSAQAVSGPPLVLGPHAVAPPVRTNWEAVQPPSGGDAGHFTHTQTVPQSVVTIEHNLGFRPAGVSLFSLDYGTEYAGFAVQHLSNTSVRISMDRPTACIVVLS